MEESSCMCFIFSLLIVFCSISLAADTLNVTHSLQFGDTLVSSGGTFQLGFFTPGTSRNSYLGMWYRDIDVRTIIWVANRDIPISNTTDLVLSVIRPGILALRNDTGGVIWSSNTSTTLQNPVAQLLDSGNLVVREANDDRLENVAWQSFNHPSDTYISGMKFGWNLVTGFETYFLSWRGIDDPSPGDFSLHLDPTGFPQILTKRGDVVHHRLGPWTGLQFSGGPVNQPADRVVMNENEVTYQNSHNASALGRFTVNQSGIVQSWTYVDRRGWIGNLIMPADICDTYGLCGANGICTVWNSRPCDCLDRFLQRDPGEWDRSDWTNGCIRRRNLSCEGDAFLRYSGIKLPDARYSLYNLSMTLDECRRECLRNCSCTAYAQLNINGRSGCLYWYGGLIDIRRVYTDGQDIYIRLASSEAESEGKNRQILIASLASVIGVVLIVLSLFIYIKKRKNALKAKKGLYEGINQKDLLLPPFELPVILAATDNFSNSNKIGHGGFGTVYKGVLKGGQEIAIKRLSKDSMQGVNEFKNEVIFIAKLQHRNLVRLLGYCIRDEECLLVYEYMPNKSLDIHLFDQTKQMLLDWPKRFNIITGIARGLMYLHQDSRLRIIHRDLKPGNVLLDYEMKPKISDFGMARIFRGNETETKTRRVVGTYGYMAPEYAVDGLFSVKSDVFSFGVLVIEILSGTRNRCFVHNDHSFNLLGHAWILYKEQRLLELVDTCLTGSSYFLEVVRTIQVGLLCVQNNQEDRPTMSTVVHMLENEGMLHVPKQPGFFTERDVVAAKYPTSTGSANELTDTVLEGR